MATITVAVEALHNGLSPWSSEICPLMAYAIAHIQYPRHIKGVLIGLLFMYASTSSLVRRLDTRLTEPSVCSTKVSPNLVSNYSRKMLNTKAIATRGQEVIILQ